VSGRCGSIAGLASAAMYTNQPANEWVGPRHVHSPSFPRHGLCFPTLRAPSWIAASQQTARRAVIWPAGRQPVIVAAYITQCTGPESKRAAMLADIGRLVREAIS